MIDIIDITNIICQKIKDLEALSNDSDEEVDFFDKYGKAIFYLHDKMPKISVKTLFIIVHRSYYTDENFLDFKNKIEQNEFLLANILVDTKCNAVSPNDQKLTAHDPFIINYELSNYIKNSIFDNENYINTLKRIARLFYSYTNVFNSNFIRLTYEKHFKEEVKSDIAKKTANKLNRQLKEHLGIKQIRNDIFKYYEDLIQNHNKFLVNIKTKYYAYKSLLANLQHIEKLPYTIDVSLIKNIDDETVFSLYQYATELNQSFSKELFRQRDCLSQDNLKNKKLQLKNCGYDIDKIATGKLNFLLKYADMTELKKVLTYLISLNNSLIDIYSNNGLYILVNTNYEMVTKINDLLTKNIINLSFLNQNPQVFFDKDIINNIEGLNSVLSNNIALLNRNYEIANNYIGELLLMDNQTLENNINTLKRYNPKFNKNILSNNKLLDCLDLFIELGFSNYIKEAKLDINENSFIVFKRCYISKLINFQSKNLKDKIETGLNFYINDSELDDYIINNVSGYIPKDISHILDNSPRNVISNNELKQFEKYAKDNLTYDFNGILISKNKILRNLSCLENSNLNYDDNDLLFSAIIYGSILDYEQIEMIKNFIYNKKYTKKLIVN
ncbi:MAG: hypothetical protein HFI87_07780 [Bacilli bacterium]|nr:hypothetical protein [Bacilli bacterium]